MRALVVLWLACGCKYRFDPQRDGATIADAAVGPALCHLPFGQWKLSDPVPMDDINSLLIAAFPASGDRGEFDAVFSDDGTSLYFTSDQSGAFQVWVAIRPSLTAAFDRVMQLGPDVNGNGATNSIFGFQPLETLHRGIIGAPYTGSVGGADLWLGNDSTGFWVWSPTSLSTPDGDGDARLTADGLTVYFMRGTPTDARDIYVATRLTIDQDFAAPALVPALNSALSDSSPVPVDGGILVVTDRATGNDDIWYAQDDGAGGFEPPYPLDVLNSSAFDGEPALLPTADGCELVFVSTRTGPYNLYHSFVTAM